MKKIISGWGRNTPSESNISFPKNLKELKKEIKKIVLLEVSVGPTVIVQYKQTKR